MHPVGINAEYGQLPCSGLCCCPGPAFLLPLLAKTAAAPPAGPSLLLLVMAQSLLSAWGLCNSQISL